MLYSQPHNGRKAMIYRSGGTGRPKPPGQKPKPKPGK